MITLNRMSMAANIFSVLVLLCFATGCSTTTKGVKFYSDVRSVNPQSLITEREVSAENTFVIDDISVARQADGLYDTYNVTYNSFENAKYIRSEKKWDDLARYRVYAVAGKDDEYSFFNDLFMDYFIGLGSWLLMPFYQITPGSYSAMINRTWCTITLLPGVSQAILVQDVIQDNAECLALEPIERIRKTSKIPIKLTLYDGVGNALNVDKHPAEDSFKVAVVEKLLENPERLKLKLSVSSDKAEIKGKSEFEFGYTLSDVVDRYCSSLNENYQLRLLLANKYVVQDDNGGDGNGEIAAGESGSVLISLSAAGDAHCCKVKVIPTVVTGVLELKESSAELLIPAGQSADFSIPFSIPVASAKGESVVGFVAVDGAGHKVYLGDMTINYVCREL